MIYQPVDTGTGTSGSAGLGIAHQVVHVHLGRAGEEVAALYAPEGVRPADTREFGNNLAGIQPHAAGRASTST
jgi:hypothetical protein